jgi:tungstate transport system permease protein
VSALGAAEVARLTWFTLEIAAASTLVGSALGVPLGALLGRADRARTLLRSLVYGLYALPPVVAGLLVYVLLSRGGPLGALRLVFTPAAIVVAEALLAVPLVAGLTAAALADLPEPVRETVRASGAAWPLATWALVREARVAIVGGVMVGFGRALAEVAAALIVGGNVRGETQTLGTAILQQVNEGDFASAGALAAVLLALALVTMLALARVQRAEERAW